MVHEQGEVIDSIESNIESTTVQVSSGTDQLRQVSILQSLFHQPHGEFLGGRLSK